MRRAVLADTGSLYALVDERDQYHAQARRDLHRLQSDSLSIAVTVSTLLETHTLVLYRLGIRTALSWLDEVANGSYVVALVPEDYSLAAERLHAYPDQPLTMFDALLAVVSERFDLPVWTYDYHFDVMQVGVWR